MQSDINFSFQGRTALVTGAARGIGREIARAYAEAGARVYLADTDADAVRDAADHLGATAIPTNVASTSDCEAAVARCIDETGRLDVLVNNAGVLRDTVLWKMTDDQWDVVMAVHAGGTFKMSRAAVPAMRDQGYGRIINITSYSGIHGNVGQANYATAKAGIIGFTLTAAKELARFGITVNAISPNAETDMVASMPEPKRQQIMAAIPAGRFAAPAEMAAAACFLASNAAAYITGVVLPVDGGLAM